MWVGFLVYWGVALPIAWTLAFPLRMGAIGIWTGLAIGLALAAIALAGRFIHKTRGVEFRDASHQ